jgi:CheY-like chemotaxis protein
MNTRLLIVDDSPILRMSIRKSCIVAGVPAANISEAGNGKQALDVLAAKPIDLILLDLHMPVMDGEQFVQAWSANPNWKNIMVTVVSTEMNQERLTKLRSMGVHSCLPKPFEPEALARLVRSDLQEIRS